MYNTNSKKEYLEKKKIAKELENYYRKKRKELNLASFERCAKYLEEVTGKKSYLADRGIIFAQHDFEKVIAEIILGKSFAVVSGFNPSSPFHLGHKVLFDVLVYLQSLGGEIFIPITNEESYVDGKTESLEQGINLAHKLLIPQIFSLGLDKEKTKVFIESEYPQIYNFAFRISKLMTYEYAKMVFGNDSLVNVGQIFYRGAVQVAQILLPQLPKYGGPKITVIPVGIDQHPYILLARDVAKKLGMIPPAEIIFKFQPSLKNPSEKMSGSKPETAIYLTDEPAIIKKRISGGFTGAISSLDGHRKFGAVPEACSVFNLLRFHCKDNGFVDTVYKKYKKGQMTAEELKQITIDFISKLKIYGNQ